MPSKLRNKEARVSFLAFQDMISTVTGVLLIVMLLLSLDVNTLAPRANESARNTLRELLREARSRLEAGAETLGRRQAELAALAHRVFVIPEPDRSGKEPVLIVLSATNGSCTRLSQTNVVEFAARDGTTEFERLLRTWNARKERLVFYVRPSGIAHFEKCLRLANARGFNIGDDNIGYDAAAEDGQYVLLSP
jgi:hypothetical protein